ncbi:hypothetical protein MMC25_004219 [Agyrium rufum]|nr:hypothetical protein [Agyrium rufum]
MELLQHPAPMEDQFRVQNGVVEALDRKRRVLDDEIARFKATKEEEFKAYKEEILSPDNADKEDVVFEEKAVDRSPEGDQDLSIQTTGQGNDPIPSSLSTSINVAAQAKGARAEKMGMDEPTAKEQDADKEKRKMLRNRKDEFHGVFTPAYLPLLEDPNIKSSRSSSNASSPAPSNRRASSPLPAGHKHRSRRLAETAPLSSSATLLPTVSSYTPLYSPNDASEQMSFSAPRPSLDNDRRSSSRSDISFTSLRSSLRQPKSPKSPKHVLFSIDNIVMSPSTSPVAERKERPTTGKTQENKNTAPNGTLLSPSTKTPGTLLPDAPASCFPILPSTPKRQGSARSFTSPSTIGSMSYVPSMVAGTAPTLSSSMFSPTSPSTVISYNDLITSDYVTSPTKTSPKELRAFKRTQADDDVLFAFDEDVGSLDDDSSTGAAPKPGESEHSQRSHQDVSGRGKKPRGKRKGKGGGKVYPS